MQSVNSVYPSYQMKVIHITIYYNKIILELIRFKFDKQVIGDYKDGCQKPFLIARAGS